MKPHHKEGTNGEYWTCHQIFRNSRFGYSLGALPKVAIYTILHLSLRNLQLTITHIHTFLVHPRNIEEAQSGGTTVQLEGKLFGLLREVYERSEIECDIDIAFNPAGDGAQYNAVRELVLNYLSDPGLDTGLEIANALKAVTTNRSKVGMLFLIAGRENNDHKVVVSRFPADSGILAEEAERGLNVEFLERVFMKSEHSYKAATFRGPSLAAGFWQGRAIDRQMSSPLVPASDYWVKGFLSSDFKTTSAQGTRRLGEALRKVSQSNADQGIRREIIAAATLASNMPAEEISIDDFARRFNLTAPATNAIRGQLRNLDTASERFRFEPEEFSRQIAFRSVELESGAVLTAQAGEFDRLFQQESLGGGMMRFSTTGVPVGEKLRKAS